SSRWEASGDDGCRSGFRRLDLLSGPVGGPLVAVQEGTEAGHAVDTAGSPAGAGLFEASADMILAGTFDLAAADALAQFQALGIVQVMLVGGQVVSQCV